MPIQYQRLTAYAMQDEDNLREALRYSATLLGELRTPTLTPQRYYELYMQAFNELTHLQVGSCLGSISPSNADHVLYQVLLSPSNPVVFSFSKA